MSSSITDVPMPQMGVSVAEGTVTAWRKQVGDWVEADETICDVSTDKIDIEVPSPASGRVVELLVAEEETVPVGTALARLATDAVPGEAHRTEELGEVPPEPRRAPAAETPEPVVRSGDGDPHGPVYSPVVTRIAAEHGIDLATVHGTGRDGRVRKQDVLALVGGNGNGGNGGSRGDREHAANRGDGASNGDRGANGGEPSLHTESPYREEQVGAPPAAEQADAPAGKQLSRTRRTIAEHMTRSLHTAAHCTTIVEADMSAVERLRARDRLSPLPFVARAVVLALQEHPALNATLEGDLLTRHHDVNLGVAVSLGDDGLIVPVVHGAHLLSAEGLAERIADLARRARGRALTPDEVRGGTFTITNPGVFGSLASTPIINQPQVGILDLETVTKRPVVVGAPDGSDAIAIRPMANLCLSWDHRALDGAQAATFLRTVREHIEEA